MAKVRYVQGKKSTFLSLGLYDPSALYFCTDTKELYKGARLYSDGVRVVVAYEALPEFALAADGILYYCENNGSGYILNEERNGWIRVISGVDGETISINNKGLAAVAAVPIAKVTGLADELKRIESVAVAANSAIATTNERMTAIEETVLSLEKSITWQNM